jgi:Protein of unknown function (DUF2442)
MNPRVTAVKYESKYKVVLTFSNKEVREFDFSSYLTYPVYSPLKNESFCQKVHVFNGTVSWDDTIDFDPDTLYLESKQLAAAF